MASKDDVKRCDVPGLRENQSRGGARRFCEALRWASPPGRALGDELAVATTVLAYFTIGDHELAEDRTRCRTEVVEEIAVAGHPATVAGGSAP